MSGLPTPGTVLGSYLLERLIGQGGMAAVFSARHNSLGKRVAIKMLLPHYARRHDIARRFLREGEAAARLSHPHVVDVTDVGKGPNGEPYLVMEYLDGEDLASYLDRRGALTVEETADLMIPVMSAVAAAHDAGIVHRDLKPHNIFLSYERRMIVPKVLDFGISKLLGDQSSMLTGAEVLGTPNYMAPEQARGAAQVDRRADQFTLGLILYECVTGRRPFEADSAYLVIAKIMTAPALPPSYYAQGLPANFDRMIERALQKEPEDRYSDVRAFGNELIGYASAGTRIGYAAEFGTGPIAERPPVFSQPVSAGATTLERSGVELKGEHPYEPGEKSADAKSAGEARPSTRVKGRKKPMLLAGAGVAGVTALAIALLSSSRTHAPPPALPELTRRTEAASSSPEVEKPRAPEVEKPRAPLASYEVDITVRPVEAHLLLDGVVVGRGALTRRFPRDGREHVLEARLAHFRSQEVRFRDEPPATSELVLEPLARTKKAPNGGSPSDRAAPPAPRVASEPPPPVAGPPPEVTPDEARRSKVKLGTNQSPIVR